MLWKLALRNLRRNARRTAITVSAISCGLAIMIWTINLQTWQYESMMDQAISTMAGDAVIQAIGYQEEPKPELVVTSATDIASTLTGMFPDATVTRRVRASGVLMSATNTVGVGLQGIDPAAEALVVDLDDKVVEGTWLDDDDKGILLGVTLAEKLGLKVGHKVVFMGQTDGEMASRLFRLKGTFRTGGSELDGFVAFAPINALQELYDAEDVASQVAVHLQDHALAFNAVHDIKAAVDGTGLEILPWDEAVPQIVGFIEMDRKSSDVLFMIIGVMVAAGVLNTVLMSVMERVREFGVMLSVGMRLAKMVLAEGLFLGLIGAAVGTVLGLALTWPTKEYGLDLSEQYGDAMESGGVLMSTVMYAEYNPERMALYIALTVVFTVVASAWPAWRIMRMRPVDAMRHQ